MNVDLDSVAFSRCDGTADISYRRFSADIGTAMSILAQQWHAEHGILGISTKAGPYLHWVLSCAATALNIPTLKMRPGQGAYENLTVAGPEDPSRSGRNIVFDHNSLAGERSTVSDSGGGFDAFVSALTRNPRVLNRVILTSGSTGRSKAVPITSEILLRRKALHLERVDLSDKDYVLATVGNDTAGGYCYPIYALLSGACILLPPSNRLQAADAMHLWRRLVLQSTYVYTTPAFLRTLLRTLNGKIVSGVANRTVFTVGGRLERDICVQAIASIGAHVIASYGSTEAGQVAEISGRQLLDEPNCTGYIDPDVTLDIVADVQDGNSEGGLVRLKSRRMADGYLDGLSVVPFKDGWFFPGDVGAIDHRGRLFIQGRVDDRLSYFGEKFSAADMESKLVAINGIDDAFITVVSLTNGERVVVLAVSHLPLEELRELIRPLMRRWQFDLISVKEIPRNHMGKIERKRLTAQYAQTITSKIATDRSPQ